MKEFIYSRNAVYETLRAKRRDVFKIELADNIQIKGKLAEIMTLAQQRKIQVVKAPRARLVGKHECHLRTICIVGFADGDEALVLRQVS